MGTTETILQSQTVSGLTVAPDDELNVKVQATGTSPTTLRAKVWKVGTAEPAAWAASTTDSAAALQGAGSIGFEAYLSGSATNAPQVASFDDLWAEAAVAGDLQSRRPSAPSQARTGDGHVKETIAPTRVVSFSICGRDSLSNLLEWLSRSSAMMAGRGTSIGGLRCALIHIDAGR